MAQGDWDKYSTQNKSANYHDLVLGILPEIQWRCSRSATTIQPIHTMEAPIITSHSIAIIRESLILHDIKHSCKLIITLLCLTRATASQLIKTSLPLPRDELVQWLILTSILIHLVILSEKSNLLHISSLEMHTNLSSQLQMVRRIIESIHLIDLDDIYYLNKPFHEH